MYYVASTAMGPSTPITFVDGLRLRVHDVTWLLLQANYSDSDLTFTVNIHHSIIITAVVLPRNAQAWPYVDSLLYHLTERKL